MLSIWNFIVHCFACSTHLTFGVCHTWTFYRIKGMKSNNHWTFWKCMRLYTHTRRKLSDSVYIVKCMEFSWLPIECRQSNRSHRNWITSKCFVCSKEHVNSARFFPVGVHKHSQRNCIGLDTRQWWQEERDVATGGSKLLWKWTVASNFKWWFFVQLSLSLSRAKMFKVTVSKSSSYRIWLHAICIILGLHSFWSEATPDETRGGSDSGRETGMRIMLSQI